jgi:hypothetical protein
MPSTTRSATQISLWRECQRKYGFSYILKIRSPATPSQELGTQVDTYQLQPYLSKGRPLDLDTPAGKIAKSALEFLPPPIPMGGPPDMSLQAKAVLPSPQGPWDYVGYLDLWLPSGGLPGISDGLVTVGDFKTTKDFRWMKTGDVLATDPQAVIYNTWAMRTTGARTVRNRWLYLKTVPTAVGGKYSARASDLIVGAQHVYEQFMAVEATAAEIHAALEKAPDISGPSDPAYGEALEYVLSLPPTTDACSNFGGCPHQHACNLSPEQYRETLAPNLFQGDQLVSTESMKARLAAKRAAAGIDVPPAPFAGVNPPEKDLPPPPVALVEAPVLSPVAPAESVATPIGAEPKKRGRPKKIALATTAEQDAAPIGSPGKETPEQIKHIAVVAADCDVSDVVGDVGTTFSVTWAEETYQPADFHSFRVGPFSASGVVQPGESLPDALRRVNNKLHAFAVGERAEKAASFKRAAGLKGAA